jgi:signal transduction histidine kinase
MLGNADVNLASETADAPAFKPAAPAVHGDGVMKGRIAAFDWSTTPLGPMGEWPQSLRTVVNILLSSRYQMWMAWGPELTFFCNDAYLPTLGIKSDWALGKPASRVWAEIWTDIGPRIQTVVTTGEATYAEGLLLFLERSGFPEETYHTFSYSPLLDDDNRISGMLCVVSEETERLIGERRVETLRDVATALAGAKTEEEVLNALREVLGRNRKDLPFTLTWLFNTDGSARLASSSGISGGHPLTEFIGPGADSPWPAHKMFSHPAPMFVDKLAGVQRAGVLALSEWNKTADQAAIFPIGQQIQEQPAGMFIAGTNPYRRYDSAYSGFIDLLVGQIAAALGNARAYDAERKRAEALAEIDRAKTTFFSNVSHELRTPLTLMLSPVEELLAKTGQDSATGGHDLLELVYRNGLRLQKLVNTLLDFSRIEAGRMQAMFEPLDLAEYTAELASNFRSAMERAGLNFVIACEPCSEATYIDREMWEKIILNLLSNALKFTFKGTVRISTAGFGDHVEVTVEDTGTGIPPNELPHIFERFHRVEGAAGRTIEGTGIGLALVYELVKLHGGTISAESEPGQGTRFRISLPEGSDHLPPSQIRARLERAPANQRRKIFIDEARRWLPVSQDGDGNGSGKGAAERTRILLAEDNADMREYVSRLLEERFDVVTASNGEEALEAAIAHPPDLILSDVMMPGLDGFGLLAEVRKRPETSTVPVILLSARAGEESRVEGLTAGADDYLIKPFTARELMARVGAHVAMKQRREEAEQSVREIQATLQSFYDTSPFLMGIAEIDGEDFVGFHLNRATAEFFGVPAVAKISGRNGIQLGMAQEINRIWVEHAKRSEVDGTAVRFEYEHPHRTGNCWLRAVVHYLGTSGAGRPRFSFIAEDITEQRRADETIRRSNEELRRANSDLEQFAYSASHDLQEPLRQVAVYSQLLERRYGEKLEAKGLEYLAYCVEGAHRMEMLIGDLLAYSQAGRASYSSEPVDVNAVVANAMQNLATAMVEAGAVVNVAPLPKVNGDAVPLTHVFQNLLSNAIKYRSERIPEIRIGATEDGDSYQFTVEDNGIGIAPEFQTQIFGIFKRLHDRNTYPGTGIGLAICQKIVERYGGRIWVESEPGRGSAFVFTLPKENVQ